MSKYLIATSEIYRVDSEEEVEKLISEAKNDNHYELKKYLSQKKERKEKKEIVDSWFQVTLTKIFNDEKEPEDNVKVNYER